MKQKIHNLKELDLYTQSFLNKVPKGSVIGLMGPLGVGKTSLVRSLVGLSSPQRVISPTFVIHQSYAIPTCIEHFDLYRLENAEEKDLLEVGYFEALDRVKERGGYLFVEWPNALSTLETLELDVLLRIKFESEDSATRIIEEKFFTELY